MREIVLGTAGHVDHGKTSLVRALTGINTDRLKEEQERGITIELGFAFLDLPCGHRLGIVDVPGHEKFVRNMVAGAAGVDLVALIIAADEGIMPQTREHFEICTLLGVQKGCVVITKTDMVDPEWLELVVEETGDFLAGSFLEKAPVVTVSSVTGEGIDRLRQVLDQLVAGFDFPEAYGPFRLPVDRIFTMKGFGAVVTGTSMSGRIALSDDVVVYPSGVKGKIRGIQVHGQERQEVEAGHRTAINVQGISRDEIIRGNVLASPGALLPSYVIDADFLYLSSNDKKLKNRARVRVHLGTAEIMGRVLLLEQDEILPGERAIVQLLLEETVGVWPGDRYVVRSYSPVRTIGGGVAFANVNRKKQRLKGKNPPIFAVYKQGDVAARAVLHLIESGPAGLDLATMAVRIGLFGKRLKKALEGPISARRILVVESDSQRMIARQTLDEMRTKAIVMLDRYHRENPLKTGLAREELKNRLVRNLDARLFQFVVQDLAKTGEVVVEEALVRLAGHTVALQEDEAATRQKVENRYRVTGLMPPRVNELLAEMSDLGRERVLAMLAMLAAENLLTRVSEDLYFDSAVLQDLRSRLKAHLEQHGEIDAQGFKTLSGVTRKFSIPLLEFFDREKLTIRVGDKRVLRSR